MYHIKVGENQREYYGEKTKEMGLSCQRCFFFCWDGKLEPELAELSDAEMTVMLRKLINEDNSPKLLGILNESLVNPNTPLPVTLYSHVDRTKLLCLLWTPLMLATYAQKLQVLKLLLDMQVVDVNAYDSSSIGRRRGALHIAARYNCLQSLELLVGSLRVAINAKDVDGCTALHLSVLTNNASAVRILLRSKQDLELNARNADGDTAAHIAAEGGYVVIMQQLMRHVDFDIFAQDAQGRDVMQRAQAACSELSPQPADLVEGESDHRSVDDCTQLIHLLSKCKTRSTNDEATSEETKPHEQLASVKHSLATNFAVRLLAVKQPEGEPPSTLWQMGSNLPLNFLGLGAPLGDVSEEDTVMLWNYLMTAGVMRDGFSTDTHEDDGDPEERSLIRSKAKAEHSKLVKAAILVGDATLLSFILSSVPDAANLRSKPEVREAISWLERVVKTPATTTRCHDWSWSQWLCFFALHSDVFSEHYEAEPISHPHSTATIRRISDDCYALEVATKRHLYVFDVLKYNEVACAVSLKYRNSHPTEESTNLRKVVDPHELLECGEHSHQPTAKTKQTLISIVNEAGILNCSIHCTRSILQQLYTGAAPA